ncbi:Bifunctional transcriptional activator/DNA repair enzyme AdaA [Rubinisphaera italica]|uniref:Bifunctional transcriptional activator/DNA repair enzyme AdaA n=2 Tax=Rubinisphaera italica TaxID=2527969 RepID=A0A5C5XCC6_9PLAN|nr:Bifunctional transcriptional activator/DNA repair enzyme AdaA [Rubinisphaera italica]
MIAETFRQNDLLVFQEGRTLLNEVHATAFFSGPTKWFFSSKFPLRDRESRIIGLIAINEPYEQVMGQDAELNQLLPAIQLITKKYSEKIMIADLAELCSLSESHFMRIFKQRMKMTAQAIIEQVRMYHAIKAIKSGTQSIALIAHDCGFYDHSAFVKRFKKLTGTAPMKYRKDCQANYETNRAIAIPEPLPGLTAR